MAKTNLSTLIDQLGAIKAQIAGLEAQEKALKTALQDLEPGKHTGEKYELTISDSERNTLDMEAVRAKLSPQFIAAHTRTTTVRAIRAKYIGDRVAAAIIEAVR